MLRKRTPTILAVAGLALSPAVATAASPHLSTHAATTKALKWARHDARVSARDYYSSKKYTSSSHTTCKRVNAHTLRCPVAWSVLTTNDTTDRATGEKTTSPIWYGCKVRVTVTKRHGHVRARGGNYHGCTKVPIYTDDVKPAVKPKL